MKTIFILLLLIVNQTIFAQNNIAEQLLSAVNYKEGHHEFYYPNGKKEMEYDVINGKINGQVIYYNNNGKIDAIRDMVNNKYQGFIKVYDNKGRVGVLQKTRNDSILMEVDSGYYFGGKHLFAVWFWSRESDSNFDKLSETNKNYYFDNFWNSYGYIPRINGTMTTYYRNGTIKKIRLWVDNKKHGEWKFYNKKGLVKKMVKYNLGVKILI